MIALSSLFLKPTDGLTLSGISSGAAFGVQFHVAFSTIVKGAAIFAGKPYHCEGTDPGQNVSRSGHRQWCNGNAAVVTANLPKMVDYAKAASLKGLIDPVSGMTDDKVYLYIGQQDTGHAGEMKNTRTWYSSFVTGSTTAINTSIDVIPSAHSIPTLQATYPPGYVAKHPPKKCGVKGLPFLELCGYDGSGAALQHLYSNSLTARPAVPYAAPCDRVFAFNQTAFFNHSQAEQYLSDTGYVFVPEGCLRDDAFEEEHFRGREEEDNKAPPLPACKLHVNLHGCTMGADNINLDYVLAAGFNEWASVNRMIVLYPQIKGAACWDNYGDTGADYALQSGAEMATVRRIVAAAFASQ